VCRVRRTSWGRNRRCIYVLPRAMLHGCCKKFGSRRIGHNRAWYKYKWFFPWGINIVVERMQEVREMFLFLVRLRGRKIPKWRRPR